MGPADGSGRQGEDRLPVRMVRGLGSGSRRPTPHRIRDRPPGIRGRHLAPPPLSPPRLLPPPRLLSGLPAPSDPRVPSGPWVLPHPVHPSVARRSVNASTRPRDRWRSPRGSRATGSAWCRRRSAQARAGPMVRVSVRHLARVTARHWARVSATRWARVSASPSAQVSARRWARVSAPASALVSAQAWATARPPARASAPPSARASSPPSAPVSAPPSARESAPRSARESEGSRHLAKSATDRAMAARTAGSNRTQGADSHHRMPRQRAPNQRGRRGSPPGHGADDRVVAA